MIANFRLNLRKSERIYENLADFRAILRRGVCERFYHEKRIREDALSKPARHRLRQVSRQGRRGLAHRHFDKKTKQVIDDELRAPRINNLDFETFKEGVLSAKSVMPSYFLTDEEINLLYEYVINFNKDKK